MSDLLAPIPGDQPFGLYLKGERQIYRALRNAFNAAQAAWRKFSETPDTLLDAENALANSTAWEALATECTACLTETSKDLEVLSWYVAAQLHGGKPFESCRNALAVMTTLCEDSISQVQPELPEGKLRGDTDEARAAEIAELRLRPFVQLFGEVEGSGLLNGPMTNLPLIGDVTFGKYVIAEKDGALDALREDVSAHIGTESQALTSKIEALQEMAALLARLDTAVKAYARNNGQTPPSVGYGARQVNDVLKAVEMMVQGLGFPWPGQEQPEDGAQAVPDAAETVQAGAAPAAAGGSAIAIPAAAAPGGRREALVAVARLATYFRTTEPHSPICLLLDRAVRWGNLSAAELYREILSDGSVGMSQMALMTGLESQGFADRFGTPGAGAAGGVEHPVLENYAAAVPVPGPGAPPAVQPTQAPAAPQAPVATPPAAPAAEPQIQASPAPAQDAAEDPQQTSGSPPELGDFQW